MYFLILFPLIHLIFSWGILLQEYKKASVPKSMYITAIIQTAFTISAIITYLFEWIAPLLFAFFFGLPCTFQLVIRAREQKYRRCTAYTEGKVVDLVFHGSGAGQSCHPVISFAVNGRYYTVESNVSCSRDEKGKTCWLKYNPNNPNEITQEEYGQTTKKVLRILSIICLAIAAIILIVTAAELITAACA